MIRDISLVSTHGKGCQVHVSKLLFKSLSSIEYVSTTYHYMYVVVFVVIFLKCMLFGLVLV